MREVAQKVAEITGRTNCYLFYLTGSHRPSYQNKIVISTVEASPIDGCPMCALSCPI